MKWPFLASGGQMGELVASLDWTRTELGPISGWPQSLRTAVGICLSSAHPMVIWWGPELVQLYNDAWVPILGLSKHPALGRPGAQVWPEVWHIIGAQMAGVLSTGEATWSADQLLPADRHGYPEEAYFTYSYSPITDESGGVGGVFTAVTETTGRVLAERRLRILRELGDISAVTAPTVEQACIAAMDVLSRGRADVPFAAIYLFDDDGATAHRTAFYGMADDPRIVPVELHRDRDGERPIWAVLDAGVSQVRGGLAAAYPGLFLPTGGPMGEVDPDAVVVVPLLATGAGARTGILFTGVSPFRELDEEYRRFTELIGQQVGTAIADAAAFEAQRRRADELAELDRAKTEFFTGVSHELRTPLTLITGPAEDGLADHGDPLSPRQRERMELISRNGGRLQRLVDTLLEFSQLEADQLKPDLVGVDLAALTRGIGESFAPALTRAVVLLSARAGLEAVDTDRIAARERHQHQITTALAGAATVHEAAAALAAGLTAALGAAGIAVYILRPHEQHLELVHTLDHPPEATAAFGTLRLDDHLPAADAAREGTPVWLCDQQAWRERYPTPAVGPGIGDAPAVVALPLQVGGRVVGVVAASFRTARGFAPDERQFALTLVGQAAQAFERTAVADNRWQLAQTLQRSLLPSALPQLPRLTLAGRYLPAADDVQAGGDWYDVLALDEHRVAIVVGDVVGNGPPAATVMGQLRSALKAYLLEGHPPAVALQCLTRFARRTPGALACTAVCLVLDTDTGQLRWARAGHLPPLVVGPGGVRYLDDARGPVLGIADDRPFIEGQTVLTPGSGVLLYTDGLIERRTEIIDVGLGRLAAAAAAHPAARPDALIDAVIDAALDGGGPADDIALIMAQLRTRSDGPQQEPPRAADPDHPRRSEPATAPVRSADSPTDLS